MNESELCKVTPGTTLKLKSGEEVITLGKPYLYPDGDDSEILVLCSDGKCHCAFDFN